MSLSPASVNGNVFGRNYMCLCVRLSVGLQSRIRVTCSASPGAMAKIRASDKLLKDAFCITYY